MVSEDSDRLWSRSTMVHRLRDLHDLEQSACVQVFPGRNALHAGPELFEVRALCSSQRMPLEEGNNDFEKVDPPLNAVLQEILAMVIVAPVATDASDPEELLELLESRRTSRACVTTKR